MKCPVYFFLFLTLFISCDAKREPDLAADTIFYNGVIYTVDYNQPKVEAVAIKADSIIAVDNKETVFKFKGKKTELIDLEGRVMIPGLIEGHAHIMGIGNGLLNVDLAGTKSYEEVVARVSERAKNTPAGEWILGRGWHQDKWENQPELVNGFPTHDVLSKAVPNHPVYLAHASGHAALLNQKAMELAEVNRNTENPNGGEIFKDLSGNPTGLLNETAQGLAGDFVGLATDAQAEEALSLALKECFKNGITGFHQAGSPGKDIRLFEKFAASNELKLRLYVMLRGTDSLLLADYFTRGTQLDLYNNQLTIRSIKLYSDGALGSRGAWLLEEYSDAPGIHGHNVMPMEDIKKITERAYKAGFQVCVHAIGDRANREVLDIYESTFKLYPENAPKEPRFRIEHAQHFHPREIPRFTELGVLPAMQAIHMSSDRPWAIDRLGRQRIRDGAYMWQALLNSGAKIINGTDAPVEPIDPIACFYASVTRKTLEGTPEGGYEPSQKMTREQALKSYTIDAAYGAFQESKKGSIEVGKWADFTILDRDIMTIPEDEILSTKVAMTIIGGDVVYDLNVSID